MVERHEVLRSSFKEDGTKILMDIHPPKEVPLNIVLVKGDDSQSLKEDAAHQVAQFTGQVFDLTKEPPFRCALLKLSDTQHVLAVSMHHIISDGWSMGLFVDELVKTYDAVANDERPNLPALSYQFADYAQWHRTWLESEGGAASIGFWRTYLQGVLPALEVPLPSDQPRKTEFNFPVRRQTISLGRQTQADMRGLAKSLQTSVHTVFLAGFLAAFCKLQPSNELPIGIMHANRGTPGTQNLIGFFSTLVMLRFKFESTDVSLPGLIDQVRTATREVDPHSGVPIGTLIENKIVDTLPRIFVDSVPRPAMPSTNSLDLKEFPFEHPPLFAVADIAVFLFDNGQDLTCLLGTNEDMFSDAAAGRLADAIQSEFDSLSA